MLVREKAISQVYAHPCWPGQHLSTLDTLSKSPTYLDDGYGSQVIELQLDSDGYGEIHTSYVPGDNMYWLQADVDCYIRFLYKLNEPQASKLNTIRLVADRDYYFFIGLGRQYIQVFCENFSSGRFQIIKMDDSPAVRNI